MTLVERVARSLAERHGQDWAACTDWVRSEYLVDAKFAISSMRILTEAMHKASLMSIDVPYSDPHVSKISQWASVKWPDMIDAALGEADEA